MFQTAEEALKAWSRLRETLFAESPSTIERGLVNFLNNVVALSLTQNRKTCFFPVHNCRPIDSARNHAAREFLKTDMEWLLMLDNDIAPPLNFLDLADGADERVDVVVPLCVVFYNNEFHFACDANDGESSGPWHETKFAGTGAMFVRRRVFERITPPWFKTSYSEQGICIAAEDEFFSKRVVKSGFRIWANYEFDCNHFRTVNLSQMFELVRNAAKKAKPASA